VIVSVQSTSPVTQFSISEQSMSRLIYTSSESESPWVRSASCMFPLRPSTPTSSPKVCRRPCSRSLGPVLMFAVLPVKTVGEC
jgi:hypothetical protein